MGANYVMNFVPGELTVDSTRVSVTGVSLARNARGKVAAVTITFDGPLNTTSVRSRTHYRLTRSNRHGRYIGHGTRRIALRSVHFAWNGTTSSVVLVPRRAFSTRGHFRLMITGLTDINGQPISGNRGSRDVRVF